MVATVIKQWHGALGRTLLVSFRDLKEISTGGVPTRPYGVDMYQYQGRFVANEGEIQLCRQGLQVHIQNVSGPWSIDYVSKGMSVFSAILEEFNQSTIGNYG